MSRTTESLRRKIAGAAELQSVVRSMKALAASSIGQYENAVSALGDYTATLELALSVCLDEFDLLPATVPASPRSMSTRSAIFFGSDQGLVGRFNDTLFEFAVRDEPGWRSPDGPIWAVGERMHALLLDAGMTQAMRLNVPTSVAAITPLVDRILLALEAEQARGAFTDVYVFHNRPTGGAGYAPSSRRLLPLDQRWRERLAARPWPRRTRPDVLGGRRQSLPTLIRAYLFVQLFQACAESLASENASRLAAMQRAEKNIDETLASLNRQFHSLRQEAIDQELFDVVSGYEARVDDGRA